MTPDEFVRRAVGVPWRLGGASFAGMDCYGLVELWHREVFGRPLADVAGRDFCVGFQLPPGWHECEAEGGATCFMTWRSGAPTHCGVLLAGGMVLHAQEGRPVAEMGGVRLTRLTIMRRWCPDIRFYCREAATC